MAYDNTEFAAFKRRPLPELMHLFGFTADLDDSLSFRRGGNIHAKVGERGGQHVKVFKGRDDFWWFTSHDGSYTARGNAKGTILDIVQQEHNTDLGGVRRILRELLGTAKRETPRPAPAAPAPAVPAVAAPVAEPAAEPGLTREQIDAEYRNGTQAWRAGDRLPDYLADRGFASLHPMFDGTFRVGTHRTFKNLVFPYVQFRDCEKTRVGNEQKNKGFKKYTKGGEAGIWIAQATGREIVRVGIVESPIDAFAHAALYKDNACDCYIAVRSGGEQDAINYAAFLAGAQARELLLLTDNDAAGMTYAAKVMAGVAKDAQELEKIRYLPPAYQTNDWADALVEHNRTLEAKRLQQKAAEDKRKAEIDKTLRAVAATHAQARPAPRPSPSPN